jgi:hypothetical protein
VQLGSIPPDQLRITANIVAVDANTVIPARQETSHNTLSSTRPVITARACFAYST